jgi:hypothetical protein
VLLTSPTVDPAELERRTGWAVKPEGACRGEVCVALPDEARNGDGTVDAHSLADRLGMPLVHDPDAGLWALGPASGPTGRALATAVAPELELPDLRDGSMFRLSSLRGQKVVLLAWASW